VGLAFVVRGALLVFLTIPLTFFAGVATEFMGLVFAVIIALAVDGRRLATPAILAGSRCAFFTGATGTATERIALSDLAAYTSATIG